jgi:hypothetical protein
MSVDTQTAPESVETNETPEQTTAPVLAPIPADDSDVRNHQTINARVRDLLMNANALPEECDALTARAFELSAHALTVSNPGAVVRERVLMHYRDDVDDETGRGKSQRFHYPAQRAAVLVTIAAANGVAAEITYRTYAYAGKRKQYTVELFGAQQDVARTMTVFGDEHDTKTLDARILEQIAKIEFPPSTSPGQQTKTKREFIHASAQRIGEQLAKILAANERAESNRVKRMIKSESAKSEWIATENASA